MLVTAITQTGQEMFLNKLACWHVQCSHVRMYLNWLNWNTVETMRAVGSQAVVLCTLYCNTLIAILSPQGFELPTFYAGWCSSAVTFFLTPQGF